MEKNVRLADIYIKIYNKRLLTMEDLSFLAKYDRECFEKTCRNLIYNIPEASGLMEANPSLKRKSIPQSDLKQDPPKDQKAVPLAFEAEPEVSVAADEAKKPEVSDAVDEAKKPKIEALLENLKKMEWNEYPELNVSADRVKNLLGSLYMEMLFPHNDRYRYFKLEDHVDGSSFNKKA